jgi:hypothetical protein
MCGQDAERRVAVAEEFGDDRREAPLEVKAYRVGVRRVDARDLVVPVATDDP